MRGVRKDITVLVKDWWDRVDKDNISTKEQMIAWLEKQGGLTQSVTKISDKGWSDFDEKIYHVLYREFSDRAVSPAYNANLYAEVLCWADSVKKRLKGE